MGAHLWHAVWRWTCGAIRGNGVELMPVHKRKYRSGEIGLVLRIQWPPARSTRETETGQWSGIAHQARLRKTRRLAANGRTTGEAIWQKRVPAPTLPKTLVMLLEEFFAQHVDKKLAPKTVERYHEQAAYIHSGLPQCPLRRSRHFLDREWNRLLACGGHHRRTKAPRPLSSKTVRNVAGVILSAFGKAIKWGLIKANPVSDSEPPVPKEVQGDRAHRGAERHADRGGERALVHSIVPRNGRGPRCPPWRSAGTAVGGSCRWSGVHLQIAQRRPKLAWSSRARRRASRA